MHGILQSLIRCQVLKKPMVSPKTWVNLAIWFNRNNWSPPQTIILENLQGGSNALLGNIQKDAAFSIGWFPLQRDCFYCPKNPLFNMYFENVWGEGAVWIYESPGFKIVQSLPVVMPNCPFSAYYIYIFSYSRLFISKCSPAATWILSIGGLPIHNRESLI